MLYHTNITAIAGVCTDAGAGAEAGTGAGSCVSAVAIGYCISSSLWHTYLLYFPWLKNVCYW